MDQIRTLLSRCASFFRRQRLDQDLDEELRSHIQLATEENQQRGMSEQEARTAALRAFGGVTQTRESYRVQRGLPFLEVLWSDLRYAVRQLSQVARLHADHGAHAGDWDWHEHSGIQHDGCRGAASSRGAGPEPRGRRGGRTRVAATTITSRLPWQITRTGNNRAAPLPTWPSAPTLP